jgi:probable rRNA maturation factor
MIHVVADHARAAWPARVVRARSRDFLQRLGERRDLTVLLTSDRRMRELNRRFRGKDRPTDVLSFPAEEPGQLGDLAISLDTARRRARQEGRALSAEVSLYLAHGVLHLLGWDHERSAKDAQAMARKEAWLLGSRGMVALSGTGSPGKRGVEPGGPRAAGRRRFR